MIDLVGEKRIFNVFWLSFVVWYCFCLISARILHPVCFGIACRRRDGEQFWNGGELMRFSSKVFWVFSCFSDLACPEFCFLFEVSGIIVMFDCLGWPGLMSILLCRIQRAAIGENHAVGILKIERWNCSGAMSNEGLMFAKLGSLRWEWWICRWLKRWPLMLITCSACQLI